MSTITKQITLADGRVLEYAEYGDLQGYPLLFHHGFMCTHTQVGLCHKAAKRNAVRIIAPHRPGYGRTTMHPNVSPKNVANDTAELMNHLAIEQYTTAGTSGGTAFTLADALYNAESIQKIIIVSGLLPFRHNALSSSQSFKKRAKYTLLGMVPWLAKRFIHTKVTQILADPTRYYDQLVNTVPPADKKVLTQPHVRAAFIESFGSCAPNGNKHLLKEYTTYWNWGFTESDLPPTVPIHFYHGTKDRLCAYNYVEAFASTIPQATLHTVHGGHFAALNEMDRIFKEMLQ